MNSTMDDQHARHQAYRYALLAAINGAAAPLSIALGGIAGSYLLAADKTLATLPVTGFNLGVALTAFPAAMLMQRLGRRYGFMVGAGIGMTGLLVTTYGLMLHQFWLFALGLLIVGSANSFTQQYRFAAADRGDSAFRAKAISWVLIGGVASAVIGPQLILMFKDMLYPTPFAGAYLAGVGLFASSLLVMWGLSTERPVTSVPRVDGPEARPLRVIMRQPRFVVAVFCGTASYALMSFVMTAAHLAMIGCGFDVTQSTLGIQWHVMAMFAPSFFTGQLIARFGKERIVATGLVILMVCAAVALHGVTLTHFYVALVLLGIGWNFGFIGATAMVTDTYAPHEKHRTQGANDMIVFGSVAFSSLMSGVAMNTVCWEIMNWLVIPVSVLCLASLWWLSFQPKPILTPA